MLKIENRELFLSLIRLGIGNSSAGYWGIRKESDQIDWNALESLAAQHGLSAVLVDGVERLPEGQRPPKPVLLQWIGETLQGYEYRYELYRRSIAELAGFYNEHGIKTMLIKGLACGMNWPKPEHRPCGDIDIWLFGQQKEADKTLAKEKGIEIDNSHQHHTVFFWNDFMVENHYDFINVHHHRSNVEFEKLLKELAVDDSNSVEVYGEKVYLPSANLHALFLLKHTMMHFASEGMSLRQLLDWGLFVKNHTLEIDWKWLDGVLERFGMNRLFDIINAICVENLGFEVGIFPKIQFKPMLKERVLNEILSPEFSVELPKNMVKRVAYKYRRWKGNAWKHELCYKESMLSAFLSGTWNHLLKPSSI